MKENEQSSSSLAPIPARSGNLTSLVFALIRDRIVDASLPPGSVVSEAALAAQMRVSKTPVREALLRLRHIGLVEPTARGVRVVDPTAKLIQDAFEHRAGLEAISARLAAAHSTPEDRVPIERLAWESLRAAKAEEPEAFCRASVEFHLAVTRAARNEVLSNCVDNAIVLTRALHHADANTAGDLVAYANDHVAVATHITAGDEDAAAQLLGAHVHQIMIRLLDAVAFADPAPAS